MSMNPIERHIIEALKWLIDLLLNIIWQKYFIK